MRLTLVNGEYDDQTQSRRDRRAGLLGTDHSASSASSAVNRRRRRSRPSAADDPAVYRMLLEADTIGVFQVESRAQMATLPRLKPATLLRHRRAGGDHPARADRRADGASVSESARRPRAGRVSASVARADSGAHARRAAVPGAAAADGDGGGRLHAAARPRSCAARSGFKRSERRMKQIEVQLREGMARQGITGAAAEQIITSITSFALYGFPESHAASFALLAYASAYLKVHYPGGVLHGAPQQPADGVLSSVDARQGRAAPRRPLSSDRRADVGLGLHGRSRRRDPARACAT